MLNDAIQTAPRRIDLRAVRLSARGYARLTLLTALATWALIVLGGVVRATDSGLGCATWPMCDGSLLPKMEYHQLIEWNHRFFATLVGGLMMATVGATLLWFRRPRRLLWLAILAAVTYITQAILGGITVILKLPQTWIAAHMGNSMLLLASLILLAMFARIGPVGVGERNRALRLLALGATLWTYIAMFTGSAVVGADADVSCPAWPQCAAANLLPVTGPQWINFGHRIAVGFSDVLLLILTVAIWRSRGEHVRLRRATHALATLYVGQVILGAVTIWTGAPPVMKSAHLALAAAVWGLLVVMTTFVWVGAPAAPPAPQGGRMAREAPPSAARRAEAVAVATIAHHLEGARLYIGLTKPRVIPLLLVPTLAAMLMAAMAHPGPYALLPLMLLTALGGALATGGAHAINHYFDRDIDARMRRTRSRPVVTGRIAPRRALAFGLALTALAGVQLSLTVNLAAALLALAGNLFYVFVYTIWLKRSSVQNIVIGGAAGAVPPLVGWAAVTGRVDPPALLLFAIIFLWTPAHFWALALVRQADYRAAGIPMLPVVRGAAATCRQIVWYATLLAAVSLLLTPAGALGGLYLAGALALGGVFVVKAAQLARDYSTARAWRLFKFSNSYLALLYALMVADRMAAAGLGYLALGGAVVLLALGVVAMSMVGRGRGRAIGAVRHGA
jgi:heme o synthase